MIEHGCYHLGAPDIRALLGQHLGRAVSVAVILRLLSASLQAQTVYEKPWNDQDFLSAAEVRSQYRQGGTIWSAERGPFRLDDLVREAAPVLWFSPDEPLFRAGAHPPQALPHDGTAVVVYYQITELKVARTDRRGRTLPPVSGAMALSGDWSYAPGTGLDAKRIVSVVIRFFFYYQRDYGVGGHLHDLESAEIQLEQFSTRAALRVSRVAGSAHGIGWYTNELNVAETEDLVIPIHLFVEEGKHTTAPDRNGDGIYNHGYDVNSYLPDAWGVRDTMNGRWFQAGRFSATMFKPRSAARVSAPAFHPSANPSASVYELRESWTSSACTGGTPKADLAGNLKGFMNSKGFCYGPGESDVALRPNGLKKIVRVTFGWVPLDFYFTTTRPYASIVVSELFAYRRDGDVRQSVTTLPLGRLHSLDGWLFLRATAPVKGYATPLRTTSARPGSWDLLYSRSIARPLDWYTSIGWDQGRNRMAAEWGVRLGIPIPQELSLNYINFRVGVRTNGMADLSRARVVFQLGVGAPW